MRPWRRSFAPVLAGLVLAVCLAPPVRGQDYFGQNKVRFESFDFKVLRTEHFDVYYYPEAEPAVAEAARMAERWYARISKALRHELTRRQPLILYSSHPAFEQTNAIYGDLGEGVGGVTEAFKRRIVIPFPGPLAEADHTIGHELVHAFQYEIIGEGRSGALGLSTAARMPLWFMEGMAEYLTLGAEDSHTAMWMRDAAEVNKLPSYGKLEDSRYFPYRFGQSLWAYVAGRYGEDAVGRVLKAAARNGDVRQAMQGTLGVSADTVVIGWHRALRDWAEPLAKVTEPVTKAAQPLVLAKRGIGRMNLGPALSPDGRQVVFFSERGQISIEMYLADAVTGKVIHAITKSAVDAEFQSLGFVSSAGEWSPDGRRFAWAAASRGRPVLAVLDAVKGRTLRKVRFPDLGEIFNPTWSPDGRRIVFSALAGGVTDLWMLDLESGAHHRLTNDSWADLQPAWSPDGRTIAFVTDRFGPAGAVSRYGHYRLALMDAESGAIRALETFADGKSINPQWAPDGRSLYFVSDHGGIPNLFRVGIEDGRLRQLTNLRTGVSGLTSLSPAITVARGTGQIVFSAYDANSFELFRLDDARREGGAVPDTLSADAAELPPAQRPSAGWADSARAAVAAADTMSFVTGPYRPRLSIDYIAQPSLGVAVGSGGVGVGGGAGLYWSDMLGDHELATMLQVANVGGNVLNNTSAAVGYQNLRHRWNWGLQASQIPYIIAGVEDYSGQYQGRPAIQERVLRFWQIERALMGTLTYPFDRFKRVELTGGLRNISFASEAQIRWYDAGGNFIPGSDETIRDPEGTFPSINLAGAGIALVYDNGVFGGTSPVMGQRYRFETSGVTGTLRYHDVLADARRYQRLARSLVLAGRVLHYGRYGPGGEDDRLTSLYVGYPWLVRGYDDNSLTRDISDGDAHAAAVFDRLFGSRLAVANVELRVPLLGALGLYATPAVPPIEAALFFDAGTAWTRDDRARMLGGARKAVSSYGLALRANLLGFAVGEVALVHPNDRPGKGWLWQFSLQPGF